MFSLPPSINAYFRPASRVASILAHALSLLVFCVVQPWAAKAYNNLCLSRGSFYQQQWSATDCALLLAAIAIPVLLARSSVLIAVNLVLSLLTALGAAALLTTASDTPFECFSVAGHYVDRTSGIREFEFWEFLLILVSYALLLIDLVVWIARK